METDKFYKHENCMDAFIFVLTVMPDGISENQIVYVHWMVQGVEGYWPCTQAERFLVKSEQMKKWHRYRPTGEYRYV